MTGGGIGIVLNSVLTFDTVKLIFNVTGIQKQSGFIGKLTNTGSVRTHTYNNMDLMM